MFKSNDFALSYVLFQSVYIIIIILNNYSVYVDQRVMCHNSFVKNYDEIRAYRKFMLI